MLPQYRSQNTSVIGLSADPQLADGPGWAAEIGVSFPLLYDHDGRMARAMDLFDVNASATARSLAVLIDGEVVFKQQVEDTAIPHNLLPWVSAIS